MIADIIIENALILTLDADSRTFAAGTIAIKGRDIAAIGHADEFGGWQAGRRIDGRNVLAMPGLVNVHNHSPLMITRGMIEDLGYAPAYTPGIPQGHHLDEDDAYALSSLGLYELLRCGSTTVVDYYRYPEAMARAAGELGLRAVIGGRIHDADPAALAEGRFEHSPAIGRASIEETVRLIERWNGHAGRIRCDWAPHAADTCSADLLREVAGLAKAGNIHTHLAQSRAEVERVRARDGLSPAGLLDATGLLEARTIAAHCIWLEPHDVERVGRAGATVAHAPIGNAKSGTVAPILELERSGARIALCTDTFSGDLFEAMRWACAMQRIRQDGFQPDAARVLRWATRSGAGALGMSEEIGSLSVGSRADIVLLDRTSPLLAPVIDGIGIVVHTAGAAAVDTVIVDGRIVIESGRLANGRGPEIVRRAQAVAEKLWRNAGYGAIVTLPPSAR